MQRWEYREVLVQNGWYINGVLQKGRPVLIDLLNRLGQEGWEMTGVVSSGKSVSEGVTLFFKRVKP